MKDRAKKKSPVGGIAAALAAMASWMQLQRCIPGAAKDMPLGTRTMVEATRTRAGW